MPIYEKIRKNLKGVALKNEMLKNHTSIKIGGPAQVFVAPDNSLELKWLVNFLKEKDVKYFIMGNGTNIIFDDRGYRGVVITTRKCFDEIKIEDDLIRVGSGIDLLKLILKSAEYGLSCLENLAGIPGTVGGAVWMNAGAFETEVKDCINRVMYISRSGEERTERLNFSYRKSPFKKGDIVTGAEFKFERMDKSEVLERIEDVKKKREEKQPLEFLSAGSVFKNPDNAFAGEIIDRLGMRGMNVGDAEVSLKHANFIVNRNNASSSDVKRLIDKIRNKVRQAEGFELELEVEFVEEG